MSQKLLLLKILSDNRPHSNFEIHEKTGMLRYSARILDLKADGHDIIGWQDEKDPQRYWYQLKAAVAEKVDAITIGSCGVSNRTSRRPMQGDLTSSSTVQIPASRPFEQGEFCLNIPVIKKFQWD